VKKFFALPLVAAFLLLSAAFGTHAIIAGGDAAGAAAIKGLAACTNDSLPANDDRSSAAVPIGFPIDFFGQTYTTLFVNNNGNVTFDQPQSAYTPYDLLSTTRVIIAPFFADVDTRGAGSGLVTYGRDVFGGHAAFCVNWVNVGYFGSHADKLNSFQLLLVERADLSPGDFDIIMNYNQIQWETGDASGGDGGLGGAAARVGYSNGTDTAFELPGSAVPGSFLDSAASGLARNSRDSLITGRYVYPVRSGVAPTGGTIAGTVLRNDTGPDLSVGGALVQACFAVVPAPPCQVTTTNSFGDYLFAGLPGGGNYFVTAFPPAGVTKVGPRTIGALFMPGGGSDLVDQDIKLIPSRPVPPDVTIETPFQAGDGTPAIASTTGATFRQVGACAGGSGTWTIDQNGAPVAQGFMTETAPGKYKGTIPPLPGRNGRATMNITIDCPGVGDKDDDFDIYIDPSGIVLDQNDDPIEGATVTLYRSDSSAGPFEQVPDGSAVMSPSNRTNPDTTGPEGVFHWDVIAGYYKVRAEKAGCHNPANAAQAFVETAVLTIPPPALGLELTLECGGGPGPSPTPTPPAGLNGDANCNGSVNSIDATIILQYSAGLVSTLPCLGLADANHNGSVNSIDATIILQYSAGLISSL